MHFFYISENMVASMVFDKTHCYTHGCEISNLRDENIQLKVPIFSIRGEEFSQIKMFNLKLLKSKPYYILKTYNIWVVYT